MTSTIRRDNWLGFKGLWSGFRISAYGQGLCQVLGLVVQCLELGFSLQEAANCLPTLKPLQHLSMHVGLSCYRCHGQLSRTCIPNLSCDHCSQSCSAKGKITSAVRHSTKMYVVHHNTLSDSFWIRIV